jgi:hypothetical protein
MEAVLVLWITFAIGVVVGWWLRVRWQIAKVKMYVLQHPELLRPPPEPDFYDQDEER